MFEEYYKKLRFSQKMTDRSLITCMKIVESKRDYVLSNMKGKNVYCHQGCNLCCHALTLTIDALSAFILIRIFNTIPYDELFPYFKSCADNRIKAQDYVDSLPLEYNNNIPLEVYEKFDFTAQSCPFVDKQNGCLIHTFSPPMCFSYFSSVPCKISSNPVLNENQKILYEQMKDKAQIVDISALENDSNNYYFNDNILGTNDKSALDNAIKQDPALEYFLTQIPSLEMLQIVSLALETSNPEKYKKDIEGINIDLLTN